MEFKVTLHEQVRYRGTLQSNSWSAGHYSTMTETSSAVLRSRRNCSSDGAERTDDGRSFYARAAVEVPCWCVNALTCLVSSRPRSDPWLRRRLLLYTTFCLLSILTTPPHLKYAATLPCNWSLMACFADINVSQGSVATYSRYGGIFCIRLTANLPRNIPVKIF